MVADFDGTLARRDLAHMVLEKFGRGGWRRYGDLLAAREITVEQCVVGQYALIDARTRQQVVDYTDGFCQLRPGLRGLLSECRRQRASFTVVSAGLDFTIRRAFRKSGLRLPRLICPKSSLAEGGGFSLSFPPRRIATSKDFKEDAVLHRRARGDRVVYIGDGAGDFTAAARADVLFVIAGSRLEAICRSERIPCRPIKTLEPVRRFVHGTER